MRYAGDIKPSDAFEILKNEKDSFLIDVRTLPEWQFSGVPDLSLIGKKVYTISWLVYPKMEFNDSFTVSLEKFIPDKNAKLFFMCKVGGRSLDAAMNMTSLGYKNCYNIAGGFEGDINEQNQRGRLSGWKAEGLPWIQS